MVIGEFENSRANQNKNKYKKLAKEAKKTVAITKARYEAKTRKDVAEAKVEKALTEAIE